MSNFAYPADKVRQKAIKGFPDGIESEIAARDIKVLLNRVAELESAMIPFARVGTLSSYGHDMVEIQYSQCVAAAQVMDRLNNPEARLRPEEWLPAE